MNVTYGGEKLHGIECAAVATSKRPNEAAKVTSSMKNSESEQCLNLQLFDGLDSLYL